MKTPLKHSAFPVLAPHNDGRHALRDLPLERESVPYLFVLPEHDIAAFCYTWVNKDHLAGSAFVVFGKGVGEKPIFEAVDGIAVSPTMNFDDWKVGSVHLKQDLQFKKAEMILEGKDASIHAHFEAFHPPYAYSFHPDGCPAFAATNRIEQAGRTHGSLRIGEKHIAFESLGARDHSWGTRDWAAPQHWKWLHAQVGPELCVHFWEIHLSGRVELRGYVLKDGEMAQVSAVEVRFEHDAQFLQKTIEVELLDTLGRTTRVKGAFYAHFPFMPTTDTTLNEAAMRCEVDGKKGMGWAEFMWPTGYLEYLRTAA